MGYVHLSKAPSRDLYERVRGGVDVAALQADGLVLHAASELDSGEVRIVDVYADEEALERGQARMMAVFAGAGVADLVRSGPQPEVSKTFELVR